MRFINKNSFYRGCHLLLLGMLCISTPVMADAKNAVNKIHGPLSVMVLGSGGPVATPAGRASAGYLIFLDGQPRILMDAGGGTYQRLAASGTNVKDLEIILLSHLHIDHTSDLSAIIKTVYFHNRGYNLANDTFPPGRQMAFRIFGPDQNGITFPPVLDAHPDTTQYPATTDYVDGHYDLNNGVERYLNVFSRAISGGIFDYEASDVNPDWKTYAPTTLVDEGELKITAVGVKHGPVPALAFRIDYKGKSVVFSGDTNSEGDNLATLAGGTDLLIYDTAIMDELPNGPNDGVFFQLHTTPSRMGEVATAASAGQLLLSHITPVTDPRLAKVKQKVKAKGFSGDIRVAEDLMVINVGRGAFTHKGRDDHD